MNIYLVDQLGRDRADALMADATAARRARSIRRAARATAKRGSESRSGSGSGVASAISVVAEAGAAAGAGVVAGAVLDAGVVAGAVMDARGAAARPRAGARRGAAAAHLVTRPFAVAHSWIAAGQL